MRFLFDGFSDSFQEVWSSVSRNKLRALLTACGVFWGIFMLIVMLGIGRGLERGTKRNLGDLTLRSVFIWSQKTAFPYRGFAPGRHVNFENADIEALRRVPGVSKVAPRVRLGGWRDGDTVSHGVKSGIFSVIGDYPEFSATEPLVYLGGRFLNPRDVDERRKVAVIGSEVKSVLFPNGDPIGEYIRVRGVHFRVVGVVSSERSGDEGDRIQSTVFVPLSTYQLSFNQPNQVGWFALTARADASAEHVEREVRATLAARHSVHPNDLQAFGSFNAAEKFGKVERLFRGIQGFVWFVGTLTLLAGVLGVSNILLITVKERTREIGIRKALGATPWDTVSLILKESIALTAGAGYLGVVAAVLALELLDRTLSKLENPPLQRPEVDLGVALGATVILMLAGAVAGLVPARHAAGISPVEALRSE